MRERNVPDLIDIVQAYFDKYDLLQIPNSGHGLGPNDGPYMKKENFMAMPDADREDLTKVQGFIAQLLGIKPPEETEQPAGKKDSKVISISDKKQESNEENHTFMIVTTSIIRALIEDAEKNETDGYEIKTRVSGIPGWMVRVGVEKIPDEE